MMRRRFAFIILPLVILGTALVQNVQAKDIKFTPNMTVQSLAGRSDKENVQLPSGKIVTVGTLRRLDAAAQRIRSARKGSEISPIRVQPAATGKRIRNRSDLISALATGSDNDTVQFPSGRRATVGQIRLIQPYVEKKLGYKFDAPPQRANLTGPALKIKSNQKDKDFWKNTLQQPDSTILESPNGKRITVGELKQYLKADSNRALAPASVSQMQKVRR